MKKDFKIKVNTKDGLILTILSIGLFIVLFTGSLFEHKYSVPMRYVGYGMPAILLLVSLFLYQVGNFTITITDTEFRFKSLFKNRRILLDNIIKVELQTHRSIKDLICKLSVKESLDFRFNTYNIEEKDMKEIIRIIDEHIIK